MFLLKFGSYLLSFFPLVLVLISQNKDFLTNYYLRMFVLIYLLLVCISLLRLIPILRRTGIPVTVSEVRKKNGEQLAYFMTYIIPFITLDITKEGQLFSLLLIIILIGVIYLKTNLYFANPMLSLLGFNIYSGKIKNNDGIENQECIILTRKTFKDFRNNPELLGNYIIEDEVIFITKQ